MFYVKLNQRPLKQRDNRSSLVNFLIKVKKLMKINALTNQPQSEKLPQLLKILPPIQRPHFDEAVRVSMGNMRKSYCTGKINSITPMGLTRQTNKSESHFLKKTAFTKI